jgi:hypothetical protein
VGCGRGASVELPLYWRVALLPRLDHPGGRRHGRCVVVDPLDACSLVLGSVLPRVIDVRCCIVPSVDLLYSVCGVIVPSLLLA